MYAQLLISLREGFEAALLITIVLSYLNRSGWRRYNKYLILGGLGGVLTSILFGLVAYNAYLFIKEKELVEAIGAFIAVPILTSVIYWMAKRGKRLREKVEREVETRITKKGALGILSLGFVFVFREGLETVLFLLPLLFAKPFNTAIGVWLGIILSLGLAYSIFQLGYRLNIRSFFYFTSILLVLVASGILGYGVHEFIEYGEEVGWSMEPWSNYIFKLDIPTNNIFHNEGLIGGILAVLIGYTTEMELIRFILQVGYLILGLILIWKAYRKNTSITK